MFVVSLTVSDHLRPAALSQTNFDAHVQWVRDSQEILNSWNMIQTNDPFTMLKQRIFRHPSGSHGITFLTKLYGGEPLDEETKSFLPFSCEKESPETHMPGVLRKTEETLRRSISSTGNRRVKNE